MLSDRRHPCFKNFDSIVSIDVIRMKSYLDSLSAVSEHANETGHLPLWNQVKFIDHDPH